MFMVEKWVYSDPQALKKLDAQKIYKKFCQFYAPSF